MSRSYLVRIYNPAADRGYQAKGRTRREAFNRALGMAGEAWLRASEQDILTTLRTLFEEYLMKPYYRTRVYASALSPLGCGVDFRRLSPSIVHVPPKAYRWPIEA